MLITKSVSSTDAPAPIAEAPAPMPDDQLIYGMFTLLKGLKN